MAVERKEKSEKSSLRLHNLTTLQRDANRILGYTAQETLDYLQSLYEKKLTTYPRTDSRFLTDDMEGSVRAAVLQPLVLWRRIRLLPSIPHRSATVPVSDHHAVIPTIVAGETDLAALPAGEREVLLLICRQVLMAVSETYRYTETVVTLECGGHSFTAKGRTVTIPGWKTYLSLRTEGQKLCRSLPKAICLLPPMSASRRVRRLRPSTTPKRYAAVRAMETAGVKDMPEDAERKGLGTPATRAAILEKQRSAGLVERRKAKGGESHSV